MDNMFQILSYTRLSNNGYFWVTWVDSLCNGLSNVSAKILKQRYLLVANDFVFRIIDVWKILRQVQIENWGR